MEIKSERPERVYLSLGSSQGDKLAVLKSALTELSQTQGLKLLSVSNVYASEPWGGAAENEFYNCAALAQCSLSPLELLRKGHVIEESLGRVRSIKWGDRLVDIDIIFFGAREISTAELSVPHPYYRERSFVLVPLLDISPGLLCPLSGSPLAGMNGGEDEMRGSLRLVSFSDDFFSLS